MPFFDSEQERSYTTDFGNRSSITIFLKPDFDAAPRVRRFQQQESEAAYVDKKIAALRKKLEDEEDDDERAGLNEQINELGKNDRLSLMAKFIYETGKGWDRYATPEDFDANRPVDFTVENVASLGLSRLSLMVKKLVEKLGGDDGDPKASSTESSSVSQQKVTVEPQSPTGSLN